MLSVGGLTSRRKVVAAAPASRRSCAVRRHDAATANLEGRRSSRSIPYSASEVSPRDVKSLPLTWKGVDLRDRSRTRRRRFTSRRNIVAAALTSRRSCVARRHDAAAANLEGRRSSRSIPQSASEVSPRDVKSLPLLRPRVGAALRVVMTLLRRTWKGVDLRDRSRTRHRRSHLAP